jgi:tRNA pseudouridine(55) synthase
MKMLLWKPYGITSNYFTSYIKNTYSVDKICYAGRLDPLAQGIMLILTDNDVKSMDTNLKHDKIYTFDILLGISTSSHDIAGTINEETNNINYTHEELYTRLHEFIKTYSTQSYPLISSYVINHESYGRHPMWWYYKNNINITIPNKSITIIDYNIISISKISCNDFYNNAIQRLQTVTNNKTFEELNINTIIENYKNKLKITNPTDYKIKIQMQLKVSSGFYIRQFCSDFGKYINIPTIALDITRTQIC